MITVDSRQRDPKSEQVVKYVDANTGIPIQWKPVRKISPDYSRLSLLARFIAERGDNKYIGGMLLNGFLVRVEGPIGSLFEIEIKKSGLENARKHFHMWALKETDRAVIQGWLFPVFEPDMDETQYFNIQAEKIIEVAGKGGRVKVNKDIFEID